MSNNREQADFFDRIQLATERFLTYRARSKQLKKDKRKTKHPLVDWLDAFLWAVCMVLLANQYLVQAYRIPSGSMIDSLNIGDHILVNKIIYGPEILPGLLKIPSPIKPKRNDIIIFENPSYISKGTVFDVAQRIIYMATLTLIDIDKDESGDPRIHFLIKRAIGTGGDHFVMENGDMKIRFAGDTQWINENELINAKGYNHNINRLMSQEQYPVLKAAAQAAGWMDMGFTPSSKLMETASSIKDIRFPDYLTHEKIRLETLRRAFPHDSRYAALYAKQNLGWYVSEGRVFPLGDNRDNSRDGRYFGPVRISKVLGKGLIIYWPLARAGKMK